MSDVKVSKHLDVSKLHDLNMCKAVRDKLNTLDLDGTWIISKNKYVSVGLKSLGLHGKLRLV